MELSNGERLLAWPLTQHVLTQGWLYGDGSVHRAVDLRAAVGTPVYAAEDGTVDQVQQWDGKSKTGMQSYGTMVRLRHADYKGRAVHTRYAHLSRVCVQKGQTAAAGTLLGYSGESGNVCGAHLHFEVLWGGARTNPLVWLDDDFTKADEGVYTYRTGEHAVQRPAGLTVLSIGPASAGDAAALRALAQQLGLPCSEKAG